LSHYHSSLTAGQRFCRITSNLKVAYPKVQDISHTDLVLTSVIEYLALYVPYDRLCGLVVRVPGYRSRGPGLIPGAIRFSEK
jgi:hypothetical protein